jgi:hypothetical protein
MDKMGLKGCSARKESNEKCLAIIQATDEGESAADNAAILTLLPSYTIEETANKWIFLSGDEEPYTYTFYPANQASQIYNSYGARGILFWMTLFSLKNVGQDNAAAFAIADPIALVYPYGELPMHTFINGNPQ